MIKKLVIIGDTNTGKTTWVKRLITGHFDTKHLPTVGVEVQPVRINDKIVINTWDCAGKENLSGIKECYYLDSDGAIIFVDGSNPNISKWIDLYKSVCPNKPYVVVASKSDIINNNKKYIRNNKEEDIISISIKTADNIIEPLKRLL